MERKRFFLQRDTYTSPTANSASTFAVFSMLAALTYPASLVQISIFSTFMALFLWRGSHDERELCRRFVAGLSLGFAGAFVFYYAPYAIQAVQKSSILLDRQAYDPPATFLFLRNQMGVALLEPRESPIFSVI